MQKMKAMTNDPLNPWEGMLPNTIRRVDSEITCDFFWIIDNDNNYGFLINSIKEFENLDNGISLRGISVSKINDQKFGKLYLILNRKDDWELFFSLCKDVISICSNLNNDNKLISIIENRLKHWQSFLMQPNPFTLPLIQQMGLYAELAFLQNNLIPKVGIREAINSWVGPESDKQDFSLSKVAIEVKSYITSKSPKVTISSLEQLISSKPLFLISYGLTESIHGKSITDIVDELGDLLLHESIDLTQIFENKLMNFGYMPGINYVALSKFIIDYTQGFEVREGFPRILPQLIPLEIISLNYIIDLHKCANFEIKLEDIP